MTTEPDRTSAYFANARRQWQADQEAGPIHLDSAYRPMSDPDEDLTPEGLDRRCIRIYRDTGRRCEGAIEWWRRADTLYCSPRCKGSARDQRRYDRARASVT